MHYQMADEILQGKFQYCVKEYPKDIQFVATVMLYRERDINAERNILNIGLILKDILSVSPISNFASIPVMVITDLGHSRCSLFLTSQKKKMK